MAKGRRKISSLQGGSKESRADLMAAAEGLMRDVGPPGARKAAPREAAEQDGGSVEGFSVEQLRELDDAALDGILDRVAELLHRVDEAFPGVLEEFVEELLAAPASGGRARSVGGQAAAR